MNIPNNIDIKDLPSKILYLYVTSSSNTPVGMSFYEECMAEYPEYFEEELNWRKIYSEIPQEVHDAYNEDFNKKSNWQGKHLGNGIVYSIEHQKEVDEEFKLSDKIHGTYTEIWNKHYSKYGLIRE